jgi:predicted Fe-Mo cluster-binding NifX family protein
VPCHLYYLGEATLGIKDNSWIDKTKLWKEEFLCIGDTPSDNHCGRCRNRVIPISLVSNLILTILKWIAGNIGGSQALMADAYHSGIDTISLTINYFSDRTGKAQGTQSMVLAIIVSMTIFLAGIWVIFDSAATLFDQERLKPGLITIAMAVFTMGVNYFLHMISGCVRRRFADYNLNICNVQNWTNFVSASVALVGIVLAEMGLMMADTLSAMIIGFFMLRGAYEILDDEISKNNELFIRLKRWVFSFGGAAVLIILSIVSKKAFYIQHSRTIVLVPTQGMEASSPIDPLLGRAKYFAIYDIDSDGVLWLRNNYRNSQWDVSSHLIHTIDRNNVGVVLAKKIGQEIFQKLAVNRINMYYVKKTIPLTTVIDSYQQGRLPRARSANAERGRGKSIIQWLRPW